MPAETSEHVLPAGLPRFHCQPAALDMLNDIAIPNTPKLDTEPA